MNKEYWANWLYAATIRAIKTFFQSFASLITVGAAIGDLNWNYIISTSTVALIYSVATSLAGLPEVTNTKGAGK